MLNRGEHFEVDLPEQKRYWQEALSGELPVLRIYPDYPPPPVSSFIRRDETITLGSELYCQLTSYCRRENVSLYAVLLAAFKALLQRHTAQDDVIVGSVASDSIRCIEGERPERFANMVVLRTNLAGDPDFTTLLNRVAKAVEGAGRNRDYPFDKVLELTRQRGNGSSSPVIHNVFALLNAGSCVSEAPVTQAEIANVEEHTTRCDLVVLAWMQDEALMVTCQYDAELFEPATIIRLLGHYQTLLWAIATKSNLPVSRLPILTGGEKHQLLVEWNNTKTRYPMERCIHELFEKQVQKSPRAIAVRCEDQQLSYQELNRRANQLARYLKKLGVGPETLVAICAERTIDLIVGLLGILKAGGAYVPLDPSYPKERLEFMLGDTQAAVILTQESLVESLPRHDAKTVCLDRDRPAISRENAENLVPQATADNLAYVIYTSGSTGNPKGVAIQHQSAVEFLSWAHTVFTADEMAGVLASTSISFDLSVFELFAPLSRGGQVFIVEDALAVDTLPAHCRITLINTVPSAIAELLRTNCVPSSACTINLAGEPLKKNLVREIYRRTAATKVYDLYGPSEDTTYSTYALRTGEGPQTIGRPINNTKVYIVDHHFNPVPVGVPGEIHIGGAGLARGYLKRPELTAEKFVPDPLSAEPGARLYKTGDLARYMADGNIELLGRSDYQVKIRGYRIELGEIEAVLSQHPSVREALVLAREDNPGDKRLAAYIVAGRKFTPTIQDLRNFLKAKLPEHMLPSALVILDKLPLTPNGKVDRRALPVPDQTRPELEGSYQTPRTPVEEMLANIWAEVLELQRVGMHDNFFDLGGHSLLATRVIARIRQTFQVELPLRNLFACPTVAELAQEIEASHRKEQGPPTLPLVSVSTGANFPLSFAQQRLWFLDQLDPGTTVYNVPGAFRLRGPLNVSVLEQCFNEIIRRHATLRTTFSIVGGEPAQVVAPSLAISLPVEDLTGRSEGEREETAQRRASEEAQKPFDLARGPLLRVSLLRLGLHDHVLLLTLHHIVADGWSMGVLYRELSAFYLAFIQGKPPPLPEVPIQYADFGVWQKEWLRGEELERQLAYWRKQLEGLSTLQLPTDRPRPAVQSYRGASQSIILSQELAHGLKALSYSEGVTLFMTLLAAFQTLLHRYTGSEDIAVGSPIAGRNRQELEGLIGFFVNTLVMRADLSSKPTFRELLSRVSQNALAAYEYQDLPFEKLVEELQPERSLSHSPLFQVAFAYQNAPTHPLEFPGVTVSLVETSVKTAKFDLHLSIAPADQGLRATIYYATDLYDGATMARLLGHYRSLLEAVVANPERRVPDLLLLTEAEAHRLLVEWNHTEREYPRDKHLHGWFEEQAEKTPAAVAVVFEEQQLTYMELNQRANQLARYLMKSGVRPEVLVGICMERSVEMVVGLLGILKAGGAYVPMDPEYPKLRLSLMLDDAHAPVLLTQEQLIGKLPAHNASVICLDRDWGEISRESQDNPKSSTTSENLAYVIYTSGSTGKPKGVAVEHRQLLNYLCSIQDRLPLKAQNSFATVSTIAADLGNTVIFSSLCTGGSLHVISKERVGDGEMIADYFSRHTIDCLKIVPSHLAALQAASHPDGIMPRRLLILGGEASHAEWVQSLRALAPNCQIFNHYGPTETTIGVMSYAVDQAPLPIDVVELPLGRPIGNVQVYLLDQNLRPVPDGMAGELYIAGDCVTRGYLNRPDLTAEKFIPNPFSSEPGARLYRTGDLARYLPDTNVEFLGRTDHQVKIRGYRIELGEIEDVLRRHPHIRKAAVVAREAADGQKQLAAYVVATPDRTPVFAGNWRYVLPNGAAVAQLNKNETDYIYQEIFERQAYLRHGITIRDGDCIFDVGANIGLFTVFANQVANKPSVYSFEPNPAVFEILKANASLYGSSGKLFNCGLSNQARTATFTFFPGFSLLSGLYADAQTEKEIVKTFMLNQRRAGLAEMAELIEHADQILSERFEAQKFPVKLQTLSSLIEEEGIDTIDLLKINVEKSELDVLNGINDRDWRKIKQIVVEVDVKAHLPIIISLFEKHGYETAVEQENLLEGTPLCYVYAIRPSRECALIRERGNESHIRAIPVLNQPLLSVGELRGYLGQTLPEPMIPSVLIFLEAFPLTPNGKLDRKALAATDQNATESRSNDVAPRTLVEELLAAIWAQLLKVDKIGVHDSFFDLGGHSLLATQAISRIRRTFSIELPLRSFFETPTVAGLAERVESARLDKAGGKASPISSTTIDKEYPLSFSQERFWFLDQLEPDNLAYRIAYGFRLIGPANIEALERALSEIVSRHETLRTTFHLRNGKPVQIISDHWSLKLSILDLDQQSPGNLDAEVQRLFELERRRPFDLSSDLLLRAVLLRLNANEHVLFVNSHHIAWDHWCNELLFKEFSSLYQAFAVGKPSPLAALPIQYKHYALWQRNMFQGAELEDNLTYWKQQLGGAPPGMNLPTDHPRKPIQNRRGGRETLMLPKEFVQALGTLSQQSSVTLFMTYLAAFLTLLHRMTGETDIVVGAPVAGRDRSETEGLIGLFLNSVALRTNLSGNPTFMELLVRVREVALGAYDHQELPFEKLVEALQPERDLSRTPVFQVLINMYNFKEPGLELDRLTVAPIKFGELSPLFDFEFYIRELDDGVHLIFLYDCDLFEASTVARMLARYRTLLEGIVADPDERLSDLPLLTDAERHQLLVEWNDTRRDYPGEKCIHELFEEQVERTPDATAVVFAERQMSYRELNRRANQLAHYLIRQGVGPEVLVGLFVERSLAMVVGLLGILKAGGAYVPLDPDYPEQRLAYLLEDSGVRVLVTQRELLERIPQHGGRTVFLDAEWGEISLESQNNPKRSIASENLAYVIYTSGTTGKPKGVMIQHRGVTNLLNAMRREPGLDERDKLLAVTTLCFDIAGVEIYLPLTVGAQIVLVEREVAADGLRLADMLYSFGVTVMQATPATWRMLQEAGSKNANELKVICGGEALPLALAEQLLRTSSSLWNMYGPTETTIWSASSGVASVAEVISLGGPIDNTQIYILDGAQQLSPIGAPGELYIAGAGVARGYLNSPDLTAEKFIPNPFSSEAGSRLYKTGDLARYLLDGNIEFLGRLDHQVKIRGFRIELGEIEALLGQHPAITESVVLARDDNPGDKRLVAYVVLRQLLTSPSNDLRSFLKQQLPDYMIPSVFVFLDALPRTSNGKVDPRALPAPEHSRPDIEAGYVSPRTPIEESLAGIWADVLNLDKVGIHDNFFEIGGHSLLATQVVARMRQSLEVAVQLRAMFTTPTIAGMAAVIAQHQAKSLSHSALDRILADLESLSEEEAEKVLSAENQSRPAGK
jgi:amino acid adenylation domain-containing protein/FkbM family methyltransferase